MAGDSPEQMAQAVIDGCAECDVCRYLMEHTPCMFFPQLYRLYDREAVQKQKATPGELRRLLDLCNFCGHCPCPNVRSDVMRAKHAFVSRDGLKPAIRLLEDVERVARVCGAYPRLTNILLQGPFSGSALKKLAGIHAERKLPVFPQESFPQWMAKRGAPLRRPAATRKIAYFAGCTGQYLFPETPRAVIEVLERNGVEVYVPEQKCCGMPSMIEGDGPLTFEFAKFNVDRLAEAVDAGYEILCSCPTCGFMLKSVLGEGACHTDAYRDSISRGGSCWANYRAGMRTVRRQWSFPGNTIAENLFKDEGYFSSIDAGKEDEGCRAHLRPGRISVEPARPRGVGPELRPRAGAHGLLPSLPLTGTKDRSALFRFAQPHSRRHPRQDRRTFLLLRHCRHHGIQARFPRYFGRDGESLSWRKSRSSIPNGWYATA